MGSGERRDTTFVSLESIDSVEISRERKGYSAYVWGVVAFLVAIGIYIVWDQPIGRIAGALAIAAMGVFLIVEHLITPNGVKATFRAGSSVLECALIGSEALGEMYADGEQPVQSQGPCAEPESRRGAFSRCASRVLRLGTASMSQS